MVSFLNEDTDSTGKKMYTSAYRDVDGKATTRVTGDVKLTGSNVQEQLTQANAVTGTLTFADNIKAIGIYNVDATNTGVFNVNGIAITVPPETPFEANIGGTPRKTVTVTGSTSYIVTRYV